MLNTERDCFLTAGVSGLDTARRWMTRVTATGASYRVWGKPMPRISDEIADCAIYFYASEEAAKEGSQSGGSGFLVQVPLATNKSQAQLYAVTNKHLLDAGFNVIRLTKKNGGIDTIVTDRQDWIPHPDGLDVEVLPLELGEMFKWKSIGAGMFITPKTISAYRIGMGDEAFLIGRLVTHAGEQKNSPVARFGNISLMADPNELIKCEGYDQEGFLVECRSLSGFSGSPVFVHTTQRYDGDEANRLASFRREEMGLPPVEIGGGQITMLSGTFGPWFLGIDWGHIPLWRSVYEKDRNTKTEHAVEANTGIACVLPAWKIMELLNVEQLVKERKRLDKEITKKLAAANTSVNDI